MPRLGGTVALGKPATQAHTTPGNLVSQSLPIPELESAKWFVR